MASLTCVPIHPHTQLRFWLLKDDIPDIGKRKQGKSRRMRESRT